MAVIRRLLVSVCLALAAPTLALAEPPPDLVRQMLEAAMARTNAAATTSPRAARSTPTGRWGPG
jgi:hypothetical protein